MLGTIQGEGTVLVEAKKMISTSEHGHVIQAGYVAASDPHYRWWMTSGAGSSKASVGLYHLCEGLSVDCPYDKKGGVVHFEKFRHVRLEELNKKSPGWAFSRSCAKGVKDYMKKAPAASQAEQKGTLPWTPGAASEEKSEESAESSSSEEDPSLKEKMQKLRDELKKLEKASQKKKDSKKKSASTKDTKKPKPGAKKGKKKTKSKEDRGRSPTDSPAAGGEKRKRKKAPKKEAKKEGRGSSESSRRRRAAKKKKKKRASNSSRSSGSEDGLFEGGGHGNESDSSNGRKVDRGPFGSGSAVKYKKGSDSESESVFRDAPLNQQASSQLKLVQYAKKRPGRLASRLLLKMQQDSARDFRGANLLPEKKTPPAATHYLQTMMLPQMGGKMNLRTLRELKTLCTALDTLAVSRPAQAADVLAQRIKALERATSEGHWSSAQFLELISPESAGLLERDELVHLTKEYLLDQKLKNYDRMPPRGGKGERKGEKGKGEKGSAGKGGKTKDKKKEEWRQRFERLRFLRRVSKQTMMQEQVTST